MLSSGTIRIAPYLSDGIDTSAIVASLLNELEIDRFAAAIATAPSPLISTVSSLEAAIVIEAKKSVAGSQLLDELVIAAKAKIIAFDESQLHLAREAYSKFGKGRHPAALNFVDCCAHALACKTGKALLFKGQDFSATDIGVAA